MKELNRISKIISLLEELYPQAECSLDYNTPIQLLIATQLSAQCTDKRVNIVTKTLFHKYTSVDDFANANFEELQEDIRSTGFYRNKAKNIIACCKALIEKYNSKVPDNMEDMLSLPGVGRKTANVVLGCIYGTPGIIVDTHAKRLSKRLGLSYKEDPVKIEFELMGKIPENKWLSFSHQLVAHGRQVCNSQKPKCDLCHLNSYCIFYKENVKLNK